MKHKILLLIVTVTAALAFTSTAHARAMDPSDVQTDRPLNIQADLSSTTGLDCRYAIIGEDTECFVLDNLNQQHDDADCDCVEDAEDICPND